MSDELPPERIKVPSLDEESFAAAWLDPDAPDPWGTIPDRHLTNRGFAIRLLRLIAAARRDGRELRDLIVEVEERCQSIQGVTQPNSQ